MEKIIKTIINKIIELQKTNIIKDWKIGTLGYNGNLELEFRGEIEQYGDIYSFSDYIMIDKEAIKNLEDKFKEITERAKNYFEMEV